MTDSSTFRRPGWPTDRESLSVAGDGAAATAAGPPSPAVGNDAHTVDGSKGACPSITHPQTRQEVGMESSFPLQGVLSIDWWESAGCIQWTPQSNAFFDRLERCQNQAAACNQPLPFELGDGQIFVHERGMGSGRASRLEFRLEWRGVTIGISHRNEATRLLSNFYLKVTGEQCLILGVEKVRETVGTWLSEWGGTLIDEWIRRLDLCLDAPNLNLHDRVFPACQAGQYVSTMRRNSSHRDCSRVT
jgi:hypothetical protein